MRRFEQVHSEATGDFSSAADYVAFWTSVWRNWRLIAAHVLSTNVVTTGTVLITLRHRMLGNSSGGRQIGEALDNHDLDAEGAVVQKRTFLLKEERGLVLPQWGQLFVGRSSTDVADRFDNPTLLLELDDGS